MSEYKDFDRCVDCGAGWLPWRELERCIAPACGGRLTRSEPSRIDLEAPGNSGMDPSATAGLEGPQSDKVSDPVNAPEHYRKFPIEVIEITELLSFTLGNVIKYCLRADYKGKPLEDLRKAEFYLRREIENRESGKYQKHVGD